MQVVLIGSIVYRYRLIDVTYLGSTACIKLRLFLNANDYGVTLQTLKGHGLRREPSDRIVRRLRRHQTIVQTSEVRIFTELAREINDIYSHIHIVSVPSLLGIIAKSGRDQKLLRLQMLHRVLTHGYFHWE